MDPQQPQEIRDQWERDVEALKQDVAQGRVKLSSVWRERGPRLPSDGPVQFAASVAALVFGALIFLAVLYGLVRFVKWAWAG
jgi:hypothetical protein